MVWLQWKNFHFPKIRKKESGLHSPSISGKNTDLTLFVFDCGTDTHAIEFDFGNNWAEAVGQSSYYSIQTKKRAGIVLILETIKDRKYWIRLNTTIEHFDLPIDTWRVGNVAD